MKCKLVDVFAKRKLNGNGLTIFSDYGDLSAEHMLAWTQEMRQFESIFIDVKNGKYGAKIFTVEEELDFAGHPLLGLAYHLHEEFGKSDTHKWVVHLNKQVVQLTSRRHENAFVATMSQGVPSYLYRLSRAEEDTLYTALSIARPEERSLTAEVISTGLPYVILPVTGLDKIKFKVSDLAPLIEPFGAKFLYVLDVDAMEGRTWDNKGAVEDIATGSAAGPAAAFLFKNGLVGEKSFVLRQGRFLGRESEILIHLEINNSKIVDIEVSGHVVKVADMNIG